MRCPNCHAPLKKDDMFCTECGSRCQQKNDSNLVAIIISSLILMVVVVGIMFWLFFDKENNSKTESEATVKIQSSQPEIESETSKDNKIIADNLDDSETDTLKKDETEEIDEAEEKEDATEDDISEYVMQQSNSRYLTETDVRGMTAQQLNYAKNEIYARHGRKFDSPELQNFFDSKSWYTGIYSPKEFDTNYSNRLLSSIEKKNAEFLAEKEYSVAPSGYQLDQ